MGVTTAATLTNIALCCFHAQQYDMICACFFKALACAVDDNERAEIWYNIGEIALVRVRLLSSNRSSPCVCSFSYYIHMLVYNRRSIGNSMLSSYISSQQ
jgi:hypothetical protein